MRTQEKQAEQAEKLLSVTRDAMESLADYQIRIAWICGVMFQYVVVQA